MFHLERSYTNTEPRNDKRKRPESEPEGRLRAFSNLRWEEVTCDHSDPEIPKVMRLQLRCRAFVRSTDVRVVLHLYEYNKKTSTNGFERMERGAAVRVF